MHFCPDDLGHVAARLRFAARPSDTQQRNAVSLGGTQESGGRCHAYGNRPQASVLDTIHSRAVHTNGSRVVAEGFHTDAVEV